jgi:hypothetical protein
MASNAKNVLFSFKKRLQKNIRDHKELMFAAYGKTRQASFESILVEQFVVSMAVAWEDFLSDLILTYVSINPSIFLKALKERIKNSNLEKFGPAVAARIKFQEPQKINPDLAQLIIDPKGWNIVPKPKEGITVLANKYLHAKYAKKFALGALDIAFIEFVRCLRNYLNHQSRMSREFLKEANINLNGVDNSWPLITRITYVSVCHYLKQSIDANTTRATRIAQRLIEISDKLV